MNSLFSYLSRRTHSNVLYKVSVWMRLFVTQVKKVQDVVNKKGWKNVACCEVSVGRRSVK